LLFIKLTRKNWCYPLVFVRRSNRKRTSLVSPVNFFTLAYRIISIILIVLSFIVTFIKIRTRLVIILKFNCSCVADKALLTIPMRRLKLKILRYLSNVLVIMIVESGICCSKLSVLILILNWSNFNFCW
jgi:hypothetical protein